MKGFQTRFGFVLAICIVAVLSLYPNKAEAWNPIQEYIIEPLSKVWEPWFVQTTPSPSLPPRGRESETLPFGEGKGGVVPESPSLIINSSGLSKQEVQSMIADAITHSPTSPSVPSGYAGRAIINNYYTTGGG